ncbi:hypothetical protein [Legionella fallonii]|uniref:Uncharacterized protein n=1 Tax=Legionella fallonii LLAP-10 TaxID=1212491 RepID=A0A098FZX6_9GAMM|nr:hypothetical protein [Legionella fallonii]CEG55787.1 conserved protein of unknown function [Legionella fallonii LLAP-10]
MLVQSILKFIEDLTKFKNLPSTDVRILDSLRSRIGYRPKDEQLADTDLQFLLDCFYIRWEETIDTEYDYMLNPGVINQRWIAFAKELAPFTDKNYLQILLPTVTNTVDFNNLTALTETVRLQNFYLGHANRVLYRKRGLCEHLIDKNYALSTCRELRSSKLSALSIKELSRLQYCKQENGEFSVDGEFFIDFADFLRQKVFTRLQDQGVMPLDLLPHLLILIEQYHTLKDNNESYSLFRQSVDNFFKCIYKHKLEDINYFYGIEIPYKGKIFYLLDFLIVIHKADSYVLDEHFNALMEWLYTYNSALKVINVKLEPLYKNLLARDKNESSDDESGDSLLNHCLNFLLSLLTASFDFIFFTGKTISFWDISKSVFSEANEMFSLLAPALANNQPSQLVTHYQKVMEQYVIPGRADSSINTWFTRYQNVHDWYVCAESNTLSKIGVNWYEPELITHALLKYKQSAPQIMSQINKFLDELVHTYTQDSSELHKRLRINILFASFIKELPSQEQRYLHLLLQLYQKHDMQNNFFNNCVHHIAHRLSQMGTAKDGGAIQFFSDMRRVDVAKLNISTVGVAHLNTIIDAFKSKLYSPDFTVEPKLADKMMTYLRSISRPILTTKEHEDAKSNANALDYLGAPT